MSRLCQSFSVNKRRGLFTRPIWQLPRACPRTANVTSGGNVSDFYYLGSFPTYPALAASPSHVLLHDASFAVVCYCKPFS